MKQQTPFFITITSEVLRDKSLNPIEKLIFTEIMALTYSCGYCYASNSHFAEIFDRTPETISRNISNLQAKGYIYAEVNISDGNSRKIYVKYTCQPFPQKHQDPLDENVNTSCQKHQDPLDENVKHSNTVSKSFSKSLKKDTTSGFSFQGSYSEIPNYSTNFNSVELHQIKKSAVKENLTTQKQDGQQNYILNTSRKNVAQKNADFNEFWNEWRAMCKAKGSPTGEKKPAEIEYQKAVKIANHQGIMRTLEAFKDFILLAFENNKHACRWLKNIHWSDFENVIADYKQQAEILKTNLKKQGKPLPIAQKSPEKQQEEVKMKEDTQRKRESVIRHLNGDETQFMNDIKKVLKSYFQALHEPWIDDFVFWIDDFVFSCRNKVAYFGFTEQKHIDTVKRNFEKFEQIITREIASTDLVMEEENLKIELKLID